MGIWAWSSAFRAASIEAVVGDERSSSASSWARRESESESMSTSDGLDLVPAWCCGSRD